MKNFVKFVLKSKIEILWFLVGTLFVMGIIWFLVFIFFMNVNVPILAGNIFWNN